MKNALAALQASLKRDSAMTLPGCCVPELVARISESSKAHAGSDQRFANGGPATRFKPFDGEDPRGFPDETHRTGKTARQMG